MADPLSALSALAVASQLSEQCLKITLFFCEVRSRVRGSREFIDTMAQQVNQLTNILRNITSSPSLQTDKMAEVLRACLNEAVTLYKFLQSMMVSSKDSRMTRFKKTFTALRKRELIEARSASLEKWKGLLVLCISEINSDNMYIASRDIKLSVKESFDLSNNTSSNVKTLMETLPTILTQIAVTQGKLRDLTSQMDASLEEAVSSARLTRNIEYIMQQFMVLLLSRINQRKSILHLHFGSNLLTHYIIPSYRNKTFARFDETMKTLAQLYSSGSRSAERVLTLTGVACGGKSQAALEFCHRAQKDQQFGAIFWVKASSVSALEKSFKTIASNLNVDQKEPIETKIKTITGILTAWPCRWLMVFDNYNGKDPTQDLGSFMPNSEQGAYLVTRKLEDLTPEEKNTAVHLPSLQLQDALDLLLDRSAVEKSDENYEQGLKLVRALEKIPLVVMQAGTYIKKHKISFAEYLGMFQKFDSRSVAALLGELKLKRAQQMLVRS